MINHDMIPNKQKQCGPPPPIWETEGYAKMRAEMLKTELERFIEEAQKAFREFGVRDIEWKFYHVHPLSGFDCEAPDAEWLTNDAHAGKRAIESNVREGYVFKNNEVNPELVNGAAEYGMSVTLVDRWTIKVSV